MYEIIFYEDKNGKSEVADWIRNLNQEAEKNLKDFQERNAGI